MAIEKGSLTAHETTAHCQRHYGSLPTTLRLVLDEITARFLFPTWECFVPGLGIFHSQGGNKCLGPLLNKQLLLKNKGTLLNHKWHLFEKVTHLSHQTAKSPLSKGLPLISSLP